METAQAHHPGCSHSHCPAAILRPTGNRSYARNEPLIGGHIMDEKRFDTLVRTLATGTHRRHFLKGLLGLGGAVALTGTVLGDHANAARRGFSGPTFPTPPPCQPACDGRTCGDDGCGGTCGTCLEGHCCRDDGRCGVPLANGTCAVACTTSEECQFAGCLYCGITDRDGAYCATGFLPGVCSPGRICPPGQFCSSRDCLEAC